MPRTDTPPVARRRNHGRGHSYEIDGRRVDGVTWILSNGVPKPALIDWAARTTAEFAVDHWDELEQMTSSKRLRALEQARWDTTRSAQARGTDVHRYALQLATGAEVDVPDELAGYVDAYLRFVEDWAPRELLVEAPVFNRTAGYAGTLDLIAELADGARWLLDWKTGDRGIYAESALQLAAYRHAEFWVDSDGREQPLPDVDFCGAVHLRHDGYNLYPVTADARVFRLFLYAQQVARFAVEAKDARDAFIGDAAAAPARAA